MVISFALLLAAQVPAAVQPVPAPQKEALVCRKEQRETGSRIRKGKQCKTEAEWAREDEERARMAPSARITEGQGDSLTKSSPQ